MASSSPHKWRIYRSEWMINFCLSRRHDSHNASISNFNEVTKEFPGWNGSLNKDGFVLREECRKVELNFAGILDEILIKLAKLDTAVKTYKRSKNLRRIFNDMLRYDGNFEKVYRKEDTQKSKTFYVTLILYNLSKQNTMI